MPIRRILKSSLLWLNHHTPQFRGKYRVTKKLHDLLLSPSGLVRVESGDALFEVAGRDHIEFRLLYFKENSPEIIALLQQLAGEEVETFWDVGANIGTISLPMAARFPDLHVFAFEPSPPVLARLINNVSLNERLSERISVIGEALSDSTGLVSFFTSNEEFNSGVGGLGTSQNRNIAPVKLWSFTGDELIRDGHVPAPQLIKIDVEGFELEVLSGLRDTLTKCQRMAIVFEHEIYRLEERGQPRDTVVGILRELGFEILVAEAGGRRRALEPADLDTPNDFVALKGW